MIVLIPFLLVCIIPLIVFSVFVLCRKSPNSYGELSSEEMSASEDYVSSLRRYLAQKYDVVNYQDPRKIAMLLRLNIVENEETLAGTEKESVLVKSNDNNFFGTIVIKQRYMADEEGNAREQNFRICHEIVHYFRDVGPGKRVREAFGRDATGVARTHDEQIVDYMAAALFLPYNEVCTLIKDADKETAKYKLLQSHHLSEKTIERRVEEVKFLQDLL